MSNKTMSNKTRSLFTLLLAGLRHLHIHTALSLSRAMPYAIGGIAAFWTIERVSAFL